MGKAKTKPKGSAKSKPKTKSAPGKKAAGKSVAKSAAKSKAAKPKSPPAPVGPFLRALRSCIFQVNDLALAKAFYSQALGKEPYFDELYYVGFDVDGQELGLDPDVSKRGPGGGGSISYWRVADINATWQHLTTIGGTSVELPHAVGVDLQTSIVADPFGNYIGLIQGS